MDFDLGDVVTDDQHLKYNIRRHVKDPQVQVRVQDTRCKETRTMTCEESTCSCNCSIGHVRCMRRGHTGRL
jgi:hypothetical protein